MPATKVPALLFYASFNEFYVILPIQNGKNSRQYQFS
ncbi:hypothetical protein SAMN06296427_101286 [Moheibacter sediminis]|uniref:Uncharacterized protein n=1 Tax=Moheibacter sediminis TaxID=1434700 RepID=A0A1W1YE63_9FLAO|nr:hypothetical protein SAMN06296427_101286 [Moheibacter sediminis]